MFLSKDKNGIWYLYFVGDDGKTKRNSTRCRLKTNALKFLQTFKVGQSQRVKQVFLSTFITDFLLYARGNFSTRTVEFYSYSLNKLLTTIGNIPLASITPKHFDIFKTERLKTMSPITVNIDLRTIRASLNTALRWGLLQSNPFSKQKLVSVPEASPIFFSKADFQILIRVH